MSDCLTTNNPSHTSCVTVTGDLHAAISATIPANIAYLICFIWLPMGKGNNPLHQEKELVSLFSLSFDCRDSPAAEKYLFEIN